MDYNISSDKYWLNSINQYGKVKSGTIMSTKQEVVFFDTEDELIQELNNRGIEYEQIPE